MRDYPYAFHVALDGAGLNGLEGRAGVCLFKYDPHTEAHAYKVVFFGGVAGGHGRGLDGQGSAETGYIFRGIRMFGEYVHTKYYIKILNRAVAILLLTIQCWQIALYL